MDAPYPMPEPESLNERPLPVPIQKTQIKASHYGRNIENMLSLIAEHEEGEVKTAMILTLAGYMKQQYLIWNKDSVSEETIFNDIYKLSDGRIKVPESVHIGMGMSDTPVHSRSMQGGSRNNHRNNQKGKQNNSNGKRWKNNK